jgi:hypothetical protein
LVVLGILGIDVPGSGQGPGVRIVVGDVKGRSRTSISRMRGWRAKQDSAAPLANCRLTKENALFAGMEVGA